MNWGKFSVKAGLIFLLLWVLMIYVYGEFVLVDNIVPLQGTTIDDWVGAFYSAGIFSAVCGLLVSAVWFFFGKTYAGGPGIGVKFYLLWFVSIALGGASALLKLLPAQDGQGASFILVLLVAPLGYFLASLFACANAVKYIPPLGTLVHK